MVDAWVDGFGFLLLASLQKLIKTSKESSGVAGITS